MEFSIQNAKANRHVQSESLSRHSTPSVFGLYLPVQIRAIDNGGRGNSRVDVNEMACVECKGEEVSQQWYCVRYIWRSLSCSCTLHRNDSTKPGDEIGQEERREQDRRHNRDPQPETAIEDVVYHVVQR